MKKVHSVFMGVYLSKNAISNLFRTAMVYYIKSRIIYHPKIYIFEGNNKCNIIIGSSNLTKPGLFSNIESSVIIEFNRKDKEGERLLQEIKNYYKDFLNNDNLNVKRLNKTLIKKLVQLHIVPKEADRQKIQEKQKHCETDKEFKKISQLFPEIKVQKPSSQFKIKRILRKKKSTTKITFHMRGSIFWIKSNLPGSDVQYSPPGTNPTGGIRLTQAQFTISGLIIDQTKYFRKDVFRNATWNPIKQNPYIEVAKVRFLVRILGKSMGEYELEIRHKPSGEAGQHNYTTSISWGELSNIIQKKDLRGKNFYLYGPPKGKKQPFFIEIK